MSLGGRGKGVACIVASAFGFAVMAACVRLCDDLGGEVSSFQKSFFRNVVALAASAAIFAFGGGARRRVVGAEEKPAVSAGGGGSAETRPPLGRFASWSLLLLRSAVGTVGIFANFYALGRISIAEGQTLNKTAPFFTVLCAWAFMKERPSGRAVASLLIAFAGVLLIAKPGFAGEAAFPLAVGLLGGVSAGAAYAALHALGRSRFPPSFVILFFSAFSCAAAVPFMAAGGLDPMTPSQLASLVGAGAGAALGQFGVTLAYRFAAPRDVAVYDYSNVVFTAALGFALFGQVPDALSVFGMLLVVAAAWRMR